MLPPTVVALPEKVPSVTFCLSVCVFIVSIKMTSPALFVVSNTQLICFPVTLPLKANCVLIGILSPSFLFPLEVIFQHHHYPSVTFPLPVFFFPVTVSFFVFFCPSYFPVIKTCLVISANTLFFPHTPFLCRFMCCLPHFVFKSSSCAFEEKGILPEVICILVF